jgi:DNA-binding MarR family transcriptional regulator
VTSARELPFDPIEEARRQWEAHGWARAAPGMAAVTSVMRVQQLMQARVDEVLRPEGLTFARYELLMLLHFSRAGALPVTRASARLQVHPTSVTNAVDRLEAAGLVVRRPHPTDGRGTLVQITEQGRALALRATGRLNEEVFARPGLPLRRLTALVQVLTDFRRSAGDIPARR